MKLIFLLCLFFILGSLKSDANSKTKVLENSVHPPENSVPWKKSLKKLQAQFGLKSNQLVILISISKHNLYLVKGEKIVMTYPVSTSKYGIGNKEGSNKTPLGTHRISEKIGKGAGMGTIFKSGINTGKVAKIYPDSTDIQEDLITTRIMWLEGLKAGINKGKGIDSYERRIYIHGTSEEGLVGKSVSRGCIRMRNKDVIELFNLVAKGTLVEIQQ